MIPTRVSSTEQAAKALLTHHYAIIKLPDLVLEVANKIMHEGRVFFDLDMGTKKAAASPKILEGYRELGSEKDAKTGRPDLSESFTAWFRNATNSEVRSWSQSCQFHQIMSASLLSYAKFTEDILKALRKEIDPDYQDGSHPVIDIRNLSYLQMNFYRPAMHKSEDRDTVMDPHEDGHILTILKPTKPGLMVSPGELVEMPTSQNPIGVFEYDRNLQAVDVAEDEAIIIPSSPTFYLTGGLVKPLFHGVANKGDDIRQSLMFFVNPTRNIPIEPWIRSKYNENVNIHSVIDAVSGQYGQSALSEIIK